MKKFKAAAVQMSSGDSVDLNLKRAGDLISAAANEGALLVALPEFFPALSADESLKLRVAERSDEIESFLSDTAKSHKVYLIGGTIPIASATLGKVKNASILFSPDGGRLARYDKMHLFRYRGARESVDETRTMEAGDSVVAIDLPIARLGLSVCYDLRFPELYRTMNQPDIIAAPSAFTRPTGRAHWDLLLRARAAENLAYVLAPAQCGEHPGGRKTWGHSAIINPWGEIIAQLKNDEGFAIAELDPVFLIESRRQLPSLENRMLK